MASENTDFFSFFSFMHIKFLLSNICIKMLSSYSQVMFILLVISSLMLALGALCSTKPDGCNQMHCICPVFLLETFFGLKGLLWLTLLKANTVDLNQETHYF